MSSRGRGSATVGGAVLLAAAALLRPSAARADTWSSFQDTKPDPVMDRRTLRSGLVVGLSAGYGLAGTSGYPNSASKIGDPAYYSATDLLHGGGGELFVMGALADYVSFGGWFGSATFVSGDWRSTGAAGGFRVEAFPLIALAPPLKDVGVLAQFGVGGATAHQKSGRYPDAKGTQSFLGAGVFYEWTFARALGGHAVLGPSLEYDGTYSQTIGRSDVLLGARVAFYGGI